MSLDIIGIIKLAAIKGYHSKKAGIGSYNLYSDQPSSAGVGNGAHSQVSFSYRPGRIMSCLYTGYHHMQDKEVYSLLQLEQQVNHNVLESEAICMVYISMVSSSIRWM